MNESEESLKKSVFIDEKKKEQTLIETPQSETAIIKRDTGAFKFPNGDVYLGWFAVDTIKKTIVRQGLGKYFVKKGGYYEGRWFNDRLQKGTIKFSNGTYYMGSLNENHEPIKRGVYFLPKRGWLIANFDQGYAKSKIRFWDVLKNEWVGKLCPYLPGRIIFRLKNQFIDEFSISKALKIDESLRTLRKLSAGNELIHEELTKKSKMNPSKSLSLLLELYKQFTTVDLSTYKSINRKKYSKFRNRPKTLTKRKITAMERRTTDSS